MTPTVPSLRYFSRATVKVTVPQIFGKTPFGERRIVQILAGRLEGEFTAEVLPGGADWQILSQGGVRHAPPKVLAKLYSGEIVAPSTYYFRSTPTFETADDRYAWLNR